MQKPTAAAFGKLTWHWVSGGANFISGRSVWLDLYEARFPVSWYDPTSSPIPGLTEAIAQIVKTGFVYVRASSDFTFHKYAVRDSSSATYGVTGWLQYVKDDLMFRQRVAAPPCADLSSAFDNIKIEHDGIALISSVLIEDGQGQLERARRHAADMLRRAGDAGRLLNSCEVECRTHGGRGGWRDKTLTKRFAVNEIAKLIGRQV